MQIYIHIYIFCFPEDHPLTQMLILKCLCVLEDVMSRAVHNELKDGISDQRGRLGYFNSCITGR